LPYRSERALTDELEAAKAAAKDATAAFAACRAARYAAFMAAFNHIAAAVDPIYKALTRAPEHPVGGSAYLSTEDAEEARFSRCMRSALACAHACECIRARSALACTRSCACADASHSLCCA
jgi:hypothetical protein